MSAPGSKLDLSGARLSVPQAEALATLTAIFEALACPSDVAAAIAEHLVDASLSGVESHGVMRALQYADEFRSGKLAPAARPEVLTTERGAEVVDGHGGIGIPAMALAYDHGIARARETGLSALAIRNVGHTGRHGAYADAAAGAGFLTIMLGGGNRHNWRQVAPHGGRRALLPTNPYCIGIPGGARGPVVLDFATSRIAGGWIYAARNAGALLPEGAIIDRDGNPSRDPSAYFDGGAILPAGEQKGYALALVAELVAEAMLGPARTECHWLLITLATDRYRDPGAMQTVAEEILDELRSCPPAPGFDRVEIPGERERDRRAASGGVLAVPERTWADIRALAASLGAA